MKDMRVRDLKEIINNLPDDMIVIIPIIGEDDVNKLFGFRKVRTAGVLECSSEEDREALCLNGACDGQDIADQVHFSGKDVGVKEVLYGESKYSGTEKEQMFNELL